MKKLQTIYEILKDFTKEQINETLLELPEDDQELVLLRYGNDLNNPTATKLTPQQNNRFYGTLLPKIRKKLYAKYFEENKKNQPKVEEFVIKSEEIHVPQDKKGQEMTKEDCLKMLEVLRTPTFTQMLSTLTPKEAIIISLKLGYVDEKYFSSEAIAKFLEIEEQEVIETTKKVLLLYKEQINGFINYMVEKTNPKTRKPQSN